MKTRSSRSQMFFKIAVLKNFCKFHSKTPVLESLFKPPSLLKRDSNAGVFLGNLRNFKNAFFYRTLPVIAFWKTSNRFLNQRLDIDIKGTAVCWPVKDNSRLEENKAYLKRHLKPPN